MKNKVIIDYILYELYIDDDIPPYDEPLEALVWFKREVLPWFPYIAGTQPSVDTAAALVLEANPDFAEPGRKYRVAITSVEVR